MSKVDWDEGPFTYDDFKPLEVGLAIVDENTRQLIETLSLLNVGKANARLKEILASEGVRVFGRPVPTGEHMRWSEYKFPETIETGILIAVEETKK